MKARDLFFLILGYLFIFLLFSKIFFICLLIFIIVLFFHSKRCLLFFIIGCILCLVRLVLIPSVNNNYVDEHFYIYDKKANYVYLVNDKFQKFIAYDFLDENLYTKVYIKGELKSLSDNSSFLVSSFKDYLARQNIHYSVDIISSKIINQGDEFRSNVLDFLFNRFSTSSRECLQLFLFGIKTDNALYNKFVEIGVVHLVVVSGFHINLLSKLIGKIKLKYIQVIIVLLLAFYVYLMNFPIPALRAFLMYILLLIGQKYKSFNMTNSYFLIIILFLIIDPYFIFSLSFQLSFFVTFFLFFSKDIKENKYIKNIFIYLGVLPLILSINHEIHLLSFVFQLVLTIPISLIYILSWIVLLFSFLEPVYIVIINLFFTIINLFSSFPKKLIFSSFSTTFYYLFYLGYFAMLIIFHFKRKRVAYSFLLFLIVLLGFEYYKVAFFEEESVVFFDVGQGDSTLISLGNNQGHILIDTGGSYTKDIASKTLIPYFKAKGIKKLDYVIITHDDFDHNGALSSLQENFNVENLLYAQDIDNFTYKDFKMINLNHFYNEFSEDNDQSGVFYFEMFYKKFLLCGDASKAIEQEIIENYQLDVDYLRVGHHGSNTSSSYEFLNNIKGEYAFISVGKYNNYGHPHKEVIDNLTTLNYKIYRTDLHGMIYISYDGIKTRFAI